MTRPPSRFGETVKMKQLARTGATVGTVLGVFALVGILRGPIMNLLDVQSATAAEAADSVIKADVNQRLTENKYEIAHLRELVVGTRQIVACNYWHVSPARCSDFDIPGLK